MEKKKAGRKKWIIPVVAVLIVVLVLAGMAGHRGKSSDDDAASAVKTAAVTTGTIKNTITASGTLSEAESSDVLIPSGISVKNVLVEAGDTVSKGDALAKVDMTSVKEQIYEVRSSISSIDSRLKQIKKKTSAKYVAEREMLNAQKSDLNKALKKLQKIKKSGKITSTVSGTIESVNVSEESSASSTGSQSSDAASGLTSLSGITGMSSNADTSGEVKAVTLAAASPVKAVTLSATVPVKAASLSAKMPEASSGSSIDHNSETEETGNGGTGITGTQDIGQYTGAGSQNTDQNSQNTNGSTSSDTQTAYGNGGTSSGTQSVYGNLSGNSALQAYKNANAASQSDNSGSSSVENAASAVNNGTNGITGSSSSALSGSTQALTGTSSITGTSSDSTASVADVSYTSAFTINTGDVMDIDLSVDELDILNVAEGQNVTVTLDAIDDESFTGTITKVSHVGTNSGGSAKYTVTCQVEKTDDMLVGMNATVVIDVDTAENVLTIPLSAVQEENGSSFVYTTNDNGTLGGKKTITTGLSDENTVEVTDGLSEGETVYYKDLTGQELTSSQNNVMNMREGMQNSQQSGNGGGPDGNGGGTPPSGGNGGPGGNGGN